MILWGAISGATATSKSFGGILTARFILGFVEAAYFPGCLYFLSCWYTRKELALRTGILYSDSLVSGAFGGLVAAGILKGMDGAARLSAWRWLFILESILTVRCFSWQTQSLQIRMKTDIKRRLSLLSLHSLSFLIFLSRLGGSVWRKRSWLHGGCWTILTRMTGLTEASSLLSTV